MAIGNSLTKNNASASLSATINAMLDKEGLRKRFEDLLGRRTPQFVSSLVSLLNASPQLTDAFRTSPATVLQASMKAATYDLPIDPALGFAYIVPFKNKGVQEAQFILGYKGMVQLALRTGVYKTINVIDVREGELLSFDRLSENIELSYIEDEERREKAKITGYVGYFKLVNGTEKTIYMSIDQIYAHEKKHRKGSNMGKGWKDDFEAMCRKTVLRKLIGSWGLMSIDYQKADTRTIAIAEAVAKGEIDDEDTNTINADYAIVEDEAQSVKEPEQEIIDVLG